MTIGPRPLTRRAFLGTVLAGAAVGAGCTGPVRVPSLSQPPIDVASLLATRPFFVAHRGGGGNWPEMTAFAYAQAVNVPGIRALEISVCRSADGVLVCSHDPTTTRTTGVGYTIAEQSWATLSALKVTSAQTTDPTQPAQPLASFDEVAEAYIDRFVLFVEAKVGPAAEPLLARMAAFAQPQRVVWKAPVNSQHFATAKRQGFTTWGYVLNEPQHRVNLDRYAASADVDLLGAPRAESDAFISLVSATAKNHGKRTIAWPIRSLDDERRVVGLGCQGLMTSHPLNVLRVGR